MNKHPKALIMLFFTEMWERFSFYGMRALLTLYLTLQLFKDIMEPDRSNIAYGIYAAYGALVYATPFIGGLIADKFLGHKKAVMLGAVLMTIGHFAMAIETEFWLYIALSFLILGNGFFKPNISSIVGQLYDKNDIRRDGGFTIFYMGVNLGAFLSPLICGTIGELYGWKYGFGIAGLGMIAGLIIFNKFKYLLLQKDCIVEENNVQIIKQIPADIGSPKNLQLLKKPILGFLNVEYVIYILSFVFVGLISLLFHHFELMGTALTIFTVCVLVLILVIAFKSQKIERDRLFVILILFFFNTLFWSFFEQAGSSLTLFTNGNIDRTIFNWQIPASIFQSINPLFILILGSPLSVLWLYLAQKKKNPGTPQKFAIGLFLLSLGFLLFGIAPSFVISNNLIFEQETYSYIIAAATVPMIFMVLSYLFQTLGELCQSPVGLSMITKLAPPKMVAMIMGAWFLSFSLSHHFAGIISKMTTTEVSAEEIILDDIIHNYSTNAFAISDNEYNTTYRDFISKAVQKGFECLVIQGNSVGVNKNNTFNFSQILDSTYASLHSNNMYFIIKDTTESNRIFTHAFLEGIKHITRVGDGAVENAIAKEYITKEYSESFSITTKYSLSNLLQYTRVFYSLGIIALAASALLFILAPFIKKMMHVE